MRHFCLISSASTLRAWAPGTFVYFCRFHSHLDSFNQPVAPGPEGGIQDAWGNFATPTGIILVLPVKSLSRSWQVADWREWHPGSARAAASRPPVTDQEGWPPPEVFHIDRVWDYGPMDLELRPQAV